MGTQRCVTVVLWSVQPEYRHTLLILRKFIIVCMAFTLRTLLLDSRKVKLCADAEEHLTYTHKEQAILQLKINHMHTDQIGDHYSQRRTNESNINSFLQLYDMA